MGYDTKRFVTPPPDAIICSICLEVCQEPVMCPDEHVYCNSCITSSLERGGMCPVDKKEMDKNQLKRSRVLKQIIDDLRLSCRYSQVGCDAVTTVEQENVHALSCKFNNSYDNESDTGKKLKRLTDEQNLLAASVTKNAAILEELQRNVANFEGFYQSIEPELFKTKENIKFEFESVKNLLNKKCSKTEHNLKKHNDNVEEFLGKVVKMDGFYSNHFEEDISCLQERLDHLEKSSMEPIEGVVKNKIETDLSVPEINDEVIEQLRSMIGKSKRSESSKEEQTKCANLYKSSTDAISTARDPLSPEKAFSSRVFTQSVPEKSSKGSGPTLMEDIFVKTGSNEDLVQLSPVKSPPKRPHEVDRRPRRSYLTSADFGIDQFDVTEEHKASISYLLERGLVQPGAVLEILKSMDFADFFPPRLISENTYRSMAFKLKYIARVIKKGMKVMLINGNAYLAVSATILAGKSGSVYCANFGVDLVQCSGFGHLLDSGRITFISSSHFHTVGFGEAAPYDLILVPSKSRFTWPMSKQLTKDGIAYDFHEGFNIKDSCAL